MLAACNGGGGSGSTPPPRSITFTVEDPAGGFNAAAYQVGEGGWQALATTGTTTKTATFDLNGQSRYGVAVHCDGPIVLVVQATAGELPSPRLRCTDDPASTVSFTLNVSVDAALLAGGDQVCVHRFGGATCQSSSSNTILPTFLKPGTDVLITLEDSDNQVKAAKVLRGLNISAGGS